MRRERVSKIVRLALALVVLLTGLGCSNRLRLAMPGTNGMERYAEERYAQALLYMEASRFELAQQQFAIVERTAVSPELRQRAHDGYVKAAGVIEAKR